MHLIQQLENSGKINPPKWLSKGLCLLMLNGSRAYGTHNEESDYDVYGVTIPEKQYIYGSTEIKGFDSPINFDQFQASHILYEDKEYDITIYSISKYFRLLIQNNPNIIGSAFVEKEDVLFSNRIGELIRLWAPKFLSKKAYTTFGAYSRSQLSKMANKEDGTAKRTKFGMHLLRLQMELTDILANKQIRLKRNSEILKEIRSGIIDEKQLLERFYRQEKLNGKLLKTTELPDTASEVEIRDLLVRLLNEFYS